MDTKTILDFADKIDKFIGTDSCSVPKGMSLDEAYSILVKDTNKYVDMISAAAELWGDGPNMFFKDDLCIIDCLDFSQLNLDDVWEIYCKRNSAAKDKTTKKQYQWSYKNIMIHTTSKVVAMANWQTSKQVFEPSTELCESLLSVDASKKENIKIHKYQIQHLPFKSFIIDFSNVKLDCFKDDNIAKTYLISAIASSTVDTLLYGSYGIPSPEYVSHDLIYDNKEFGVFKFDEDGYFTMNLDRYKDDNDLRTIHSLIFNLMMYLTSEVPDVMESIDTKKTYRPSKYVHNKYREIRKWDVGYRYAKSIKESVKHTESTKEREIDADKEHVTRRPHVRKAHWHHYWCGKGKTQLIVKWIDVIHVNVTWNSELPVVAHEEEVQSDGI